MNKNCYFECKVSRDAMGDDGMTKKVKEVYIVDALNFAEAENRIIKEVSPYTNGEIEAVTVKKCKFSEIISRENGDKYYKVKVILITIDEKTGADKEAPFMVLVQSDSLSRAFEKTVNLMKDSLNDYRIASIAETPILDVFTYETTGTQS